MINCQFEDKNKASLRHVTVDTIIVKAGKVLLGKRGTFRGKPILESGKWGLIGGFLERDENLEQAVRREAREETGLELKNIFLLKINDNPNRPAEDRQNVSMIFVAEPEGDEKVNSEEVWELRWFDLEDLPPYEQIAFDFSENLKLYKNYLKEKFDLPMISH
ncbi:MAG: NUDIX hydrolase [Parcubacteria group bacterium]|jgi:ADP-ribose pyrophosphatase YjhB (NUDIX family)